VAAAAIALFVIPNQLIFMIPNPDVFFIRWLELPSIERELGFQWGEVTIAGEEHRTPGVTSVTPGSPFERAGIRAGDVPCSDGHSIENPFLRGLFWLEVEGTGELCFYSGAAIQKGDWTDRRRVRLDWPGGHQRR
jgi:hypothetical protein